VPMKAVLQLLKKGQYGFPSKDQRGVVERGVSLWGTPCAARSILDGAEPGHREHR
jgi:hypothetical protein